LGAGRDVYFPCFANSADQLAFDYNRLIVARPLSGTVNEPNMSERDHGSADGQDALDLRANRALLGTERIPGAAKQETSQ
jgi:hypothetical protein